MTRAPHAMTDEEIAAYVETPECAARTAALADRLAAGEDLSVEDMAAAVGLPVDRFAPALADALHDVLAETAGMNPEALQ